MSTLNYPDSSLDQQSFPAVKRLGLVYSLSMKELLSAEKQSALQRTVFTLSKDRGNTKGGSLKRNKGQQKPQINSKLWPTFLCDLFWLCQKIALVHRLVSTLEQFPQQPDFRSHKNSAMMLGCLCSLHPAYSSHRAQM